MDLVPGLKGNDVHGVKVIEIVEKAWKISCPEQAIALNASKKRKLKCSNSKQLYSLFQQRN